MKRSKLRFWGKLLAGSIIVAILSVLFIEIFVKATVKQADRNAGISVKVISIDDRPDFPGRPSNVGWCGEASIQMAALYYGAFIPQTMINRIASPKNPDLYYDEIPAALRRLHLSYDSWYDFPNYLGIAAPYIQSFWRGRNHNLDQFINWIKHQIIKSHPVLIGVKIYPNGNPDWPLDHFMLAIGFDGDKLVYNPNYRGTERQPINQMKNTSGYSFNNKYNYYYGYAITGFDLKDSSKPVSIEVISESADIASVNIIVDQIEPHKEYDLVKYTADMSIRELNLDAMEKKSFGIKQGQGINQANKDNVSTEMVTIYRCYEK